MANNKNNKTVILPNAIGDWTKYRPSFAQERKARSQIKGKVRLSEKEIGIACSDNIRTIEDLIETLKDELGSPSCLNSMSVEQMNYTDVLKEADYPLAQFRLFEGETLSGYLCISLDLCSCLINRALGTSIPTPQAPKMLTKIEESILSSCVESACRSALKPFSLQLADSSSLSFDQPFGENGPFILASSGIDFSDIKNGRILIATPSSIVRGRLEKKTPSFSSREAAKLPGAVKDGIFSDVEARLGATFISAKDIFSLEEGDVLLLDSSINNLLPVYVNDSLKLFGQPGIKNDRLSVRVFSSATKKQERYAVPSAVIEEVPSESIPAYEDMPVDEQAVPGEEQMAHF